MPGGSSSGFFTGLFDALSPVLQRHIQDEQRLKDAKAQMLTDAIKTGLPPDQRDAAFGELEKLYSHSKPAKEIFNKIKGILGGPKGQGQPQGGAQAPQASPTPPGGLPPLPQGVNGRPTLSQQPQPTQNAQNVPYTQPGGLGKPSLSSIVGAAHPPQLTEQQRLEIAQRNRLEQIQEQGQITAQNRGGKVLRSWTGDDGREHVLMEYPGQQPVEEIHGGVKTPALSAPRMTGEYGQREMAQKTLDNPNASEGEKKQAQATIDSLDAKDKKVAKISEPAIQSIPDAKLREIADFEITTGRKPSFGLGKSADRDRYNAIFADQLERNPQAAADRATYQAGKANLTQLTRMRGQISSFEDAFQADLQNAKDAADNVSRGSMRTFNSWQQFAQANLEDNPQLAAFRVATQTAINQYARLMYSATGGGVSTDSSRAHAEELLNTAMATGAFSAALSQMQKEAKNRVAGIDQEIKGQTEILSGPKVSHPGTNPPKQSKAASPDDVKAYAKQFGISEEEAKKDFLSKGYVIK
jgi:hypothetical protein